MAHNIEIVNGVASFAENGKKERAWHGLGQVFDRPMFVEEALKASHADYRVELRPIIPIANDMAMFEGLNMDADTLESDIIPGFKATMRMDTHRVLGLVSDTYGVVQNEDAFKFIDTLCCGKDTDRKDCPTIESCGVLGNGERVFITCKFPEDIIISTKNDDRIERYIIFTTSHDGTGAVRCVVSDIRVVCNNTLRLALNNNSGRIAFRHSANVMSRLDLMNNENAKFAYQALNLEREYNDYFKAELERLRSLQITKKQVMDIVANVVLPDESLKVYNKVGTIEHEDIPTRSKNLYNSMLQAVHEGIGQEYIESGNGLWLINGITSFYQNNANYKNDEVKFMSIMDGNVAKKVQKAYELVA